MADMERSTASHSFRPSSMSGSLSLLPARTDSNTGPTEIFGDTATGLPQLLPARFGVKATTDALKPPTPSPNSHQG